MNEEILKSMEGLNRQALETVKRVGEINARTVERLSERQLSVATQCVEHGLAQLHSLGATKDVKEALSLQAKFSQELGAKVVEHLRATTEILLEARVELGTMVEDGMKAAFENPLAKSAKKAA